MKEGLEYDKKSLRTVMGKTADFKELARDCVAFANAKGGVLDIGIEDHDTLPPANQRVPNDLPERIIRRINERTINGGVTANKEVASNGGEYVALKVLQSRSSVASTTTGQYLMRDNDSSRNLLPDELIRLLADKTAYCWETKVTQKATWHECDSEKLAALMRDLDQSERVSRFVKEKGVEERLSYYQLIDDEGLMTNLGVLWIGTQSQRARLLYSPIVQYIKYDAQGEKVSKRVWADYELNPKELIESIWHSVPDWRESNEVSEGLWRKEIPAYDERVVREVLCNALVHRPYTTRGDIFINLHPDRMVVVNPGQLPYGVTPSNVLQKTVKRNDHLSKLFYDLHLMEAEGSGYDMMYETLLSAGKRPPLLIEGNDSVEVTVERKIVNREASRLMEFLDGQYSLSQKNKIALGIIIQCGSLTGHDLSERLQLQEEERLRTYVHNLVEDNILCTQGQKKGMRYQVNPRLVANSRTNLPTTLKTIEPYRLKALIVEDLRHHPNSLISDITLRLPDVDHKVLQNMLRNMVRAQEVLTSGGRRYCRYYLPPDEDSFSAKSGKKTKKTRKW